MPVSVTIAVSIAMFFHLLIRTRKMRSPHMDLRRHCRQKVTKAFFINGLAGLLARLQGLKPNFSMLVDVGAEESVWQLGFACFHARRHLALWLKLKMPP